MINNVSALTLIIELEVTNAQSKMIVLLGAMLAGTTMVHAHGHVSAWEINGETKGGFNPSNAAQYGPTAERPTDNSDQGESYSRRLVSVRLTLKGSPITLLPRWLVVARPPDRV